MDWSDLKFWKLDKWRKLDQIGGIPPRAARMRALDLTPFNSVKAVIIGQDPYHRKGQANGLCFSVNPHVKPLPASLRNILAEYSSDLGVPMPKTGDLSLWAERGILLLNSVLSVEPGKPNSHKNRGWEQLTYEIVSTLSYRREGIVWMLWGNEAQQFMGAIDQDKHCVICSAHPSPLARSAPNPFLGSKPFSRCNDYLKSKNIEPIDWRLRE
jgi:uracil-DNA glycosylase